MRTLKGVVTAQYEWKRARGTGQVLDRHADMLTDEAWLIVRQQAGSHISGSMNLNIKVEKADGPDGVSYVGKWTLQQPTEAGIREQQ